ncbi:GNAT family N-acetyltransferase [Blastomonas sp.]|uniref:GNAT family N-acetyltransferase n=1 Tax=Blastomonas sp. TaxID=1909299 RepID=UPI00406A8A25
MDAPDANAIAHETTGHGGRFVYTAQGAEAELTYAHAPTVAGQKRVSADHTYVPDSMRGQGIAARLVDALIATAREQQWQVIPRCSYVVVAFQRHPEWSDVRAD